MIFTVEWADFASQQNNRTKPFAIAEQRHVEDAPRAGPDSRQYALMGIFNLLKIE